MEDLMSTGMSIPRVLAAIVMVAILGLFDGTAVLAQSVRTGGTTGTPSASTSVLRGASRRVAVGRSPATTRKRSKVKLTLIGAAIGGGLGAAGGLYYGKATGDGAYPQAIPAFGGIGAGIGAVAGFIVALF
jgi:hypothetical protein